MVRLVGARLEKSRRPIERIGWEWVSGSFACCLVLGKICRSGQLQLQRCNSTWLGLLTLVVLLLLLTPMSIVLLPVQCYSTRVRCGPSLLGQWRRSFPDAVTLTLPRRSFLAPMEGTMEDAAGPVEGAKEPPLSWLLPTTSRSIVARRVLLAGWMHAHQHTHDYRQ